MVQLTWRMIDAGRKLDRPDGSKGCWSREQLELLGLPWPPPANWRTAVVGRPVSDELAETFLALSGRAVPPLASFDGDAEALGLELTAGELAEPGCRDLLAEAVRVREAAAGRGLRLDVRAMRLADGVHFHWMFRRASDGVRVLDYRPVTGRWQYALTVKRGETFDREQLLNRAAMAAGIGKAGSPKKRRGRRRGCVPKGARS